MVGVLVCELACCVCCQVSAAPSVVQQGEEWVQLGAEWTALASQLLQPLAWWLMEAQHQGNDHHTLPQQLQQLELPALCVAGPLWFLCLLSLSALQQVLLLVAAWETTGLLCLYGGLTGGDLLVGSHSLPGWLTDWLADWSTDSGCADRWLAVRGLRWLQD